MIKDAKLAIISNDNSFNEEIPLTRSGLAFFTFSLPLKALLYKRDNVKGG